MLALVQLAADAVVPVAGSLRERVVLVTGATGGLGRACALAAAAAGATVVLLGRKVRPLEALYDEIERGGGAAPAIYPMDLAGATPKDHADLAAAVERECGRLDGIVMRFEMTIDDQRIAAGGRLVGADNFARLRFIRDDAGLLHAGSV